MSAHVVIGRESRVGDELRAREIRIPRGLAVLHPNGIDDPPHHRRSLWFTTFCDLVAIDRLTGVFSALSADILRHGGVVSLTPDRMTRMDDSVLRWRAQHPSAVPSFLGGETGNHRPECDHVVACGVLARIVWLHGCCRIAVERCKRPALSVS